MASTLSQLLVSLSIFWAGVHTLRYLVMSLRKDEAPLPLSTRPRPPFHSAQFWLRLLMFARSETTFVLRDVRLDVSTTSLNESHDLLAARLRAGGRLRSAFVWFYGVGATVGLVMTFAAGPVLLFMTLNSALSTFPFTQLYQTTSLSHVKRGLSVPIIPQSSISDSLQVIVSY
jgi:hypothetical protein